MELESGSVFAGRFRIERELGRGGMGIVYAAHHLHLDRTVAIKVIQPRRLGTHGVARLLREARATARLSTAHVVQLLDADVLSTGEAFLAMEYLVGEDLASKLRRDGPLPKHQALDYAAQVCGVLCEAARTGIVHRDLKPANLFLHQAAMGEHLKVLDFGISKLDADATQEPTLTAEDAAVGSPQYMSPEQLKACHEVDARSDIWAFGVTLYEMLTGKRPFDANSSYEVCERVVRSSPQAPSVIAEGLSSELEQVVLRCLEKSPERRFQTAIELARALMPMVSAERRAELETCVGHTRPLPNTELSPRPALPELSQAQQNEASPRSHTTLSMASSPQVAARRADARAFASPKLRLVLVTAIVSGATLGISFYRSMEPSEVVLGDSTPLSVTAVELRPSEPAPSQVTPSETAPSELAPSQVTPSETAPSETAPVGSSRESVVEEGEAGASGSDARQLGRASQGGQPIPKPGEASSSSSRPPPVRAPSPPLRRPNDSTASPSEGTSGEAPPSLGTPGERSRD